MAFKTGAKRQAEINAAHKVEQAEGHALLLKRLDAKIAEGGEMADFWAELKAAAEA